MDGGRSGWSALVAVTAALLAIAPIGSWSEAGGQRAAITVAVTVAPILGTEPGPGRLVVVAVPAARAGGREPRHRIGDVGRSAVPIAGVDVEAAAWRGRPVIVDGSAAAFPMESLADLPAGEYEMQAVLDLSQDRRGINEPGNLYSRPRRIRLDPAIGPVVRLELTERIPAETRPVDTEHVRFVRMRSARLSSFHGRSIELRAAVIVPRGFDEESRRRYPVRVSVGGYGQRDTAARRLMESGSRFRTLWLADDTPRLLHVMLDGAGPFGDPYQVNSANNGPYGDAVVQELLPYIEDRFRGIGRPDARVLEGSSTGGWVSLALQIFYPDEFNGAWASCPDAVDFRAFQRVNIYRDDNAYVDASGNERPSRRGPDGRVRFTMRHEVAMENVLGRDDHWSRSGRQWGAWNAVYGPRGADGLPRPLWDPASGTIDRSVVSHWEAYDLRLVLARRWVALSPKLQGKLAIAVGDLDDYYLNEAVRLLEHFFETTDPTFDVRITYGAGHGHCWSSGSDRDRLFEMARRTGATP